MLDLSTVLSTDYYRIKLADGRELELRRPTQALQETLMSLKDINPEKVDEATLVVLMNIFVRILNRNVNGYEFTYDEIAEEYDVVIALFTIQDYFSYWNQEIEANVNFHVSQ